MLCAELIAIIKDYSYIDKTLLNNEFTSKFKYESKYDTIYCYSEYCRFYVQWRSLYSHDFELRRNIYKIGAESWSAVVGIIKYNF